MWMGGHRYALEDMISDVLVFYLEMIKEKATSTQELLSSGVLAPVRVKGRRIIIDFLSS